jgi:voltage-gated potassium channel
MKALRQKLYSIIFEADTREGKLFDEILLGTILFSILLVMLESVPSIRARYYTPLRILEWTITAVFTIEYFTRIWVVHKPVKYIFSFYGLVDLFALLPTYLGLLFAGGQSLIVIRAIRLLRVFRILKLSRYTRAGRLIAGALWNSREKISVFIIFVLTLALIIGTLIYLIEGEKSGFTDIPPVTGLGKFLASIVMILGYSIIAVPTGIVTASLLGKKENYNTQVCRHCLLEKHDDDARFCKRCGASLEE